MINVQATMINQIPNSNVKNKYDLIERTASFGEQVIDLAKKFPVTPVSRPIISQFVRSGTSTGANYCEANEAGSKRDFNHKISLARKEAKETMHWLRMLARIDKTYEAEIKKLWKEAHELVLIFTAILKSKK